MTKDELAKEHGKLVIKMFRNPPLTQEEKERLSWIRDELDKIDMEIMGPSLDRLEKYVEKREKLARDIQNLASEYSEYIDAEEFALEIAKTSFGCDSLEEAFKKLDEGYLRGSTAYAQLNAIRDLMKDD